MQPGPGVFQVCGFMCVRSILPYALMFGNQFPIEYSSVVWKKYCWALFTSNYMLRCGGN